MIELRSLVVSDSAPSGNISSDATMENWLWYKPTPNEWHIYKSGQWVLIPKPLFSIPEILENKTLEGTTVIDGKLFVGKDEGYHEDISLKGLGTLKVRRGVIIGWKEE